LIPVQYQPEPLSFDARVRVRGKKFLAEYANSEPLSQYWRRALPDLWTAYGGVCAYSCHWIPLDVGSASVDHFIPKSKVRSLAYEWDNFRLAAAKLNAIKGNYTDILDPFKIEKGWFALVFPGMLVIPGPSVTEEQQAPIQRSIDRLKLNKDEVLVNSRLNWVLSYCEQQFSFEFLGRRAPFIAAEIERQNLKDTLAHMFLRKPTKGQLL